VDSLFLGVVRLRKSTPKHCRGGDVLASLSELWGIIPPIHDVALDLASVTLGDIHWVTHMGRSVVRRVRLCRSCLVPPPLS